jgi:hypothetical protein
MVSTSPQSEQTKVRNSGISVDLGVNCSSVIGSPQYLQEGAQIFPFIFNNIAAAAPAELYTISGTKGGQL